MISLVSKLVHALEVPSTRVESVEITEEDDEADGADDFR